MLNNTPILSEKEKIFMDALTEMANWERTLTHAQRIQMTVAKAQKECIDTVYKKYINKILK